MRIDVGDRIYVIETPPPRQRRLPSWPGLGRVARHVLFTLCALLALGLLVANLLAWRGDLPGLEEAEPAPASIPAVTTPQTAPEAGGTTATTLARVTIDAREGPCYLVIRGQGPNGELLFRGLLEEGQGVQFAEPRLWIRAGATQNVTLQLNGERITAIPEGAAELIVTPQGVRSQTPA